MKDELKQLVDPKTYQPLVEYPTRSTIRSQINEKVVNNEIEIPKEYLTDTKKYIDLLVEEGLKRMLKRYREVEGAAIQLFQSDMEKKYEFESFPEKIKNKIHSTAWDLGHSFGFSEVDGHYEDLIEIARFCLAHK